MKKFFLLTATLLTAVLLNGCVVVVHDTAPRRAHRYTRVHCGVCNGYGCGNHHHRSYHRTVVVQREVVHRQTRNYTSSSHHSHRRYAPAAPAAPRQVRRSYQSSARPQVSRSRNRAPDRHSMAQKRADERQRTKKRRRR